MRVSTLGGELTLTVCVGASISTFVVEMSGDYTSENIRFTQKENCVFAIQLGWAGANQRIAIKSLGRKLGGHLQIKNVTVLDSPEEIDWFVEDDALYVTTPAVAPNDIAICYKVELAEQ